MRKYTGPTLGGGKASVQCPDWCVVDHAYWEDLADDLFHRGAELSVEVPAAPAPSKGALRFPLLAAHLVTHSTDLRPCAAAVSVALSENKDDCAELDVKGVDELLVRLDSYRERLAGLRETLATIHEERRSAHRVGTAGT